MLLASCLPALFLFRINGFQVGKSKVDAYMDRKYGGDRIDE